MFCLCFILSASAQFFCPLVSNTISPVAALIFRYESITAATSTLTQNIPARITNATKKSAAAGLDPAAG